MGAVKENQQGADATEAGHMVDRFRARRNEPDCQAGLIGDRGQDPIGQSRQRQIGLGASITTFERPAHADDVNAIFGVMRRTMPISGAEGDQGPPAPPAFRGIGQIFVS